MKNSTEILLTAEEIKQIEEFVLQNPIISNPYVFNISSGHTSVVKVSHTTGLIIVEGNEFTGFQHIHSRHEYYSTIPYWVDSQGKDGSSNKKLQDQSRFRPDSVPFWDYISIADSVYKPENINIEQNTRLDDFDLYFGDHTNKDGSVDKYKLLTYKNSKVVHTFYLQSKKYNKKRVNKFNLARGMVIGQHNLSQGIVEITIPYADHENKIKYSVLVRKYLDKKTEEVIVLIHSINGEAESFVSIGERKFSNFKSVQFEIMIWQQADLRNIEEQVKRIDNSINSVEK